MGTLNGTFVKTSVENKVVLGFVVAVLTLLGMGWVSYCIARNLVFTEYQFTYAYKVIATLEQGHALLTDAETAQRGFLLTGDEVFQKDSTNAQAQVAAWIQKLRKYTADEPEQQQRLAKLEPLIEQRLALLNERMKLRREKGLQAVSSAVATRAGKTLMDQIEQGISEMHVAENVTAFKRQAAVQNQTTTAEITIWGVTLVACVIGLASVIFIHRDLKKRKQAQETLRQNEERLRMMIESVKDYAILMLSPGGRIISWNDGAQRIKGYSAEEIIGQHFSKFYPEAVVATGFPEHELREAAAKGRFEDEGWRVRKDGSQFWANVVVTAMHNSRGELIGFVKVTRDLTERKKAEDKIYKLNTDLHRHSEQLETANKELEAFSYSVSHDLRAPLRHIDGFVKLLDKHSNGHLDERSRRYLEIIADSAQRMGALIDDLLIFSRMGRTEMRRGRVNSRSLVDEVITSLQNEIGARKISWKIGELPEVDADAAMLRQVWVNLIGNAVKYSRPRDLAEIEIGCNVANEETVFFIKDNGVGFDMQYAHKLFGVFQRLHRSEDFEGTGIGLANVQRIVHRHEGRVWAESEVDKGATFYFSLPQIEIAAAI